jgi:hypothetical protein
MKTNAVKFIPITCTHSHLITVYTYTTIEQTAGTKYLDLLIDNHRNCNQHIDQILLNLTVACSVIRNLFPVLNSVI